MLLYHKKVTYYLLFDWKGLINDMKTLVIYTSQTGFTKRYAEWISEELDADIYDLKDVKKKTNDFFETYEAIIYAGWCMAGMVVKVKWFFEKAAYWKNNKNSSEDDRKKGEMISKSYDISGKRFIDPVVDYVGGKDNE